MRITRLITSRLAHSPYYSVGFYAPPSIKEQQQQNNIIFLVEGGEEREVREELG